MNLPTIEVRGAAATPDASPMWPLPGWTTVLLGLWFLGVIWWLRRTRRNMQKAADARRRIDELHGTLRDATRPAEPRESSRNDP